MKLWKDNKADREYDLTIDYIVERYFASPISKSKRYGSDTVKLSIFIAERECGLGSVYECNDPDFNALVDAVKAVRKQDKVARDKACYARQNEKAK